MQPSDTSIDQSITEATNNKKYFKNFYQRLEKILYLILSSFKSSLRTLCRLKLTQKNLISLFFFLGLGLIAYHTLKGSSSEQVQPQFHIDSVIPPGFVLVPIEIVNGTTLSSLIGRNGLVDLYLTANGKKTKKVISKVKIVQATNEPDSFAVLLKENESQKILKFDGPFFATIQNPHVKSKEIFQSSGRKITINYQN